MNYFLSVNEILSDGTYQYSVMPLEYSEYQRLMLKPYSYPVKRGAWRLITDKKNCNYVHEDADGNTLEDNASSSADYKILTTWADQKRKLKLTIKVEEWDSEDAEEWEISGEHDTTLKFKTQDGYAKINADCSWSADKSTYEIILTVSTNQATDDETIIKVLQEGFARLKEEGVGDGEIDKALTHTDGFVMCSAPSKFKTFSATELINDETVVVGRTFNCHVVQVPMVEIIGKFNGIPEYQMRYVRKLSPIVLENLDNYGTELKINGISTPTECELPEETHEEILERAVTLAKIAWAGGTATTQAQAQQRDR